MMLEDFIWQLKESGIADILLPFILIFTLIFAVLQKSHILGKDKKNYNVIVALVMGLAVVIPHVTGSYPVGRDVVDILNNALPNVSLVVVVILMVLLVVGVFGFNINLAGSSLGGWIALLAAIIVVYIFGSAAEWYDYPPWLYWLQDPSTQTFIIVILIFAIIIWFVTREQQSDEDKTFAGQMKKLLEKPDNPGKEH
jgi:Kef-type K+ transport system membrane component KefB